MKTQKQTLPLHTLCSSLLPIHFSFCSFAGGSFFLLFVFEVVVLQSSFSFSLFLSRSSSAHPHSSVLLSWFAVAVAVVVVVVVGGIFLRLHPSFLHHGTTWLARREGRSGSSIFTFRGNNRRRPPAVQEKVSCPSSCPFPLPSQHCLFALHRWCHTRDFTTFHANSLCDRRRLDVERDVASPRPDQTRTH
jgi:hypothetical protein